jgi:hypothetical protein
MAASKISPLQWGGNYHNQAGREEEIHHGQEIGKDGQSLYETGQASSKEFSFQSASSTADFNSSSG